MYKLLSMITLSTALTIQPEYVTVDSMQMADNNCLNKAIKVRTDMQKEKSFRILVLPNESPVEIKNNYTKNINSLIKIQLINTTDTTVSIRTQDGSLIMIQEALDKNGKWKPIEYWMNSDCGNSYMMPPLTLNPGEYSVAGAARYKGRFHTKLRIKLINKNVVYYSNAFEGSVNLKQFTKPQMDGLRKSFVSYLEKE